MYKSTSIWGKKERKLYIMKKTKKLISLISTVAMIVTMFASMSVAKAETASGDGWTFDTETGVLTVTKDISLQYAASPNPWKDNVTTDIKKVVFAEGVTTVFNVMFSTEHSGKVSNLSDHEKKIEEVVFPSTIEKVDYNAFGGQSSLAKITWSETPKEGVKVAIGNSAFSNINSNCKIELPKNLGSIGTCAFMLNLATSPIGQYEVVIPASCESIDGGTTPFQFRTHIKRITFEEGCQAVLGYGAVTNLSGVEMRIPGTVTVSSAKGTTDNWLCRNTSIPSVIYTTADSAVKTAIQSETNGKNVTFKTLEECEPYRVEVVGTDTSDGRVMEVAYDTATKTMHIYNSAKNTKGGIMPSVTRMKSGKEAMEFYSAEVKNLVIHEGITEIESFAFCHNYSNMANYMPKTYTTRFGNLETVSFPSTLTRIGTSAFGNCDKLKSLTIPASVATIEEHAFCATYVANKTNDALSDMYFEGAPTLCNGVWQNFADGRTIKFHYGAYAADKFDSMFTSNDSMGDFFQGGAWSNGSKSIYRPVKHEVDATLNVSGTTATATYKNWTTNAINGKFIVAAYDANDRFISATIANDNVSVEAGGATVGPKSGTATATVDSGAAYYKAFVWDDITTMVPQTKAVSTN